MKNSLQKGLMVFLTILCTSLAYSQDVSGTVSDATGALPGVSILIKGTKTESVTDFDGKFSLKDVGANAVLVFSYIGLKTQEVTVSGRSSINVTMAQDQSQLNEVIVIGYGTTSKKDATGAVDQLSAKRFDNISATSPAELLRGKVSGVQITSTSGEPGAASTIRIRGNGSLRSGNGPLIVVDGVPLAGGDVSSGGQGLPGLGSSSAKDPLSFINQNDIESMTVLKDASSTAIYGARGANGVIIITTKKGKNALPEFTFSTSYVVSNYASDFDVLSTQRFSELQAGTPANIKGGSFDWKDEILQTGTTMNNDISFSSGTENSNTRVSLGMTNLDGIVRNTGQDKYTAALYNSNDFFDHKLKIETHLSYSNVKDQRGLVTNDAGYVGNLIGSALYWNPTINTRDADGSYHFVGNDYINPVHLLNAYSNKGNLNKFLGSISATIHLTSDLKYNFLLGIEQSSAYNSSQLTPDINIADGSVTNPGNQKSYFGQANINSDQRTNKTIEHNLTYTKDITEDINLNAIVGYSYYDYMSSGFGTSGRGYAASQTNLVDNIEGGVPSQFRTNSYKNKVELQSVFARVSMAFYDRLNLDMTIRRDGSSKASDGNKYGNFPSVGLAYKLIAEKEGILNELKLRGSVGKTGNTEFPANSSVSIIQYNGPDAFTIVNNANTDLKWETSTSYGVGTDFTLLDGKLSGSVDYFVKDTEDLIIGIPSTSGQPSPQGIKYKNLDGTLRNSGFEFGLNYNAIHTTDWNWNISTNMAFLDNKIDGVGTEFEAGNVNGQGLSGAFVETIKDGYPIYTYKLNNFVGYDAAGQSQYQNPDGSIVSSANAQKVITDKQALPKTTLGVQTQLSYKAFDFSMSIYGAFGHYLYNNTDNALFFKAAFGGKNSTEEVATSEQSTSDSNAPSTKYLEDGSFLRIGNMNIGYTFKGAALERMKIKSARVYFNGSNLYTFTDYSGFDPEVDTNKERNGLPSAGIDYFSYPKARSFAFGLNLTF